MRLDENERSVKGQAERSCLDKYRVNRIDQQRQARRDLSTGAQRAGVIAKARMKTLTKYEIRHVSRISMFIKVTFIRLFSL